jgi:hypothetical protein
MSWSDYYGIPPYGTGSLINLHQNDPPSHTPVISPIALSGNNQILVDNEPNAQIFGGFGTYVVTELQPGALIAMSGGSQIIRDFGGSATINGSPFGASRFIVTSPAITNDTLSLGAGHNVVFLGGTRGTSIFEHGGADHVWGAVHGDNTFSLGPTGGFLTIGRFTLTTGNVLDLSRIAPQATESNVSNFVTLKTIGSGPLANTLLTVAGSSGVEHVTLYHTGPTTLAEFAKNNLSF